MLIGMVDENGNIVKVDMDRQILKPLSNTGKMFCYDSPEYVIGSRISLDCSRYSKANANN